MNSMKPLLGVVFDYVMVLANDPFANRLYNSRTQSKV
jgi:hypothetical protein